MDKNEKQMKSTTRFEEDMSKVTWVLENFDELTIEEQLLVLSAITEMKNFILPIYGKYHEDALHEKADMLAQLLSMFEQNKDED